MMPSNHSTPSSDKWTLLVLGLQAIPNFLEVPSLADALRFVIGAMMRLVNFMPLEAAEKAVSDNISGDEGKAVGTSTRRRLCCLSNQYKIIKIKFAISVIAVTPATASTKARLASL